MHIEKIEISDAKVRDKPSAETQALSESISFASANSIFSMCIHRHVGFLCIFVFGPHVPDVVTLGMGLAPAPRVSIIIKLARFCGGS